MAAVLFITCACGISRRVALDPASKDFYTYARLIMTGEEKDIFNLLPGRESRAEFIEDFWKKRDLNPDTEANEFKEEFYQRIEYANRYFREGIPGWKTDRGRIFIYLGPPDKVESRPWINDPSVKGMILWGYYKYHLGIEFVDRTGDGRYSMAQHSGAAGGLLGALERAKFGQIFSGETDFGRIFSEFDLEYHEDAREIVIRIPVESLEYVDEGGKLSVEFEFQFYIYAKNGLKKDQFKQEKEIRLSEGEILEMENVTLRFPYDLPPGEYTFDVVVWVKPDIAKIRKYFKIKTPDKQG